MLSKTGDGTTTVGPVLVGLRRPARSDRLDVAVGRAGVLCGAAAATDAPSAPAGDESRTIKLLGEVQQLTRFPRGADGLDRGPVAAGSRSSGAAYPDRVLSGVARPGGPCRSGAMTG